MFVIGAGIVVVSALLVGAIGLAWGYWSFAKINRVDLDLAQAEQSEPRNYLVVGSDSREEISEDDPDAGGMLGEGAPAGQRADSIMIARVDPGSERIDLLSVPRDLWVPIGATGEEQRINTAYSQSAQAVVDTVETSLGIPIHHFVEVDFRGFQSLIDALDGVPLYFESPVRDTYSGLSIAEPGCAVLDGHQGLAFARSRHLQWSDGVEWHRDPTGDLGRATRQQLLTRAALARAQTMGLGDVGKIRHLVDAGLGSVTIDASLGAGDLIALGRQISDLPPDRMQTHALAVTPHRTSGGAEVVLLDSEAAEPVLQIFRGDLSSAPVTTTTAPPPSPSAVTVDVLNGSELDGEARRVSFVLSEGGFTSGSVDSAEPTEHTTVAYPSGSVLMARLVAAWLSPDAELVEDDGLDSGLVRVTLGRDFESVFDPGEVDLVESTTTTTVADEVGVSGNSTTDTSVAPTTTTQPGWVPGTPPAGVSCP